MDRFGEDVQVIDDEVIALALRDAGEKGVGRDLDQLSPTVLAQVVAEARTLKLSFKNILKIDNLHGFDALTTLCLDNNIIRTVANVDHLVNLTWLDLSFNCLTKITGLEKLVKLKDASFFSNLLTDIEGLDHCRDLECLSLGNNKIATIDSIVKLRCFKKLQLLNMEGNPVAKEGEYRMYVLAYLNDLTYLDYSMVTKADTVAAREQYQDELLDVEEKEALEDEKAIRELAAATHTERLVETNLAVVETIFDDMFAEDAEFAKLKHLPGVAELVNSFQSEVESASDFYLQTGLARDDQKKREQAQFEQALHDLRAKYAGESVGRIEEFLRLKKRAVKEWHADAARRQYSDAATDAAALDPVIASLKDLTNALMDLEMRQVEQCDELIGEFEAKRTEIKRACLEGQQAYFRLVEEHENSYTRDLMQLANELLERAAKEELPDDLADEATSLLMDRDTCIGAVTGSHDVHVGKLYKREDEAKNIEENHFKAIVNDSRDAEHQRNRESVTEFKNFEMRCLTEVRDLVTRDADDDMNDQDQD